MGYASADVEEQLFDVGFEVVGRERSEQEDKLGADRV